VNIHAVLNFMTFPMLSSKLIYIFFVSYTPCYSAGASETVVLNMSTLAWSVVTSVQGRVSVASEVLLLLMYLSKNS
jgi:hypothetical protein